MPWSPGWQELIIILVIVIFIFGAKRLKEIARGTGEAVREFKEATAEPSKEKEEEEAVIEAARKMGVQTEGRSIQQILEEMGKKAGQTVK
ncbi:MAG: twin-arginine translocase TatA/TatE family subunit [Candidatus Bathyarchaeota archaeon]|nr:twin-arginine translocase TatA/TatE family subunit [Candidatus Bathyarchaeota archaeon]